jgi:dTDP-4-dehydrorhamnose reductase
MPALGPTRRFSRYCRRQNAATTLVAICMGRCVLLAGASGQLGRDISRALDHSGYRAIALGADELDVLRRSDCVSATRRFRPDAVVDCSVPISQPDPRAVFAACREGAANLATAAREVGAYSVYISCAEVFSGVSDAPYVETDAPDPETTLGRAKLEAERAAAGGNPRSAIVRTAWLFGTGAPNFAEHLLEAARVSERVPVDLALTSNPTYTGHLAEGIVRVIARPEPGIFHLAASGECTQFGFARVLFREAGVRAEPALASRTLSLPKRNRVLASARPRPGPLPHWRAGIRAYLSARRDPGRPLGDRPVDGDAA